MKGRFFTEADDAQHPPVIIVSATTARHLFGTDDPIGQTFNVPKFQYRLYNGNEATVVGIVSDVKYSGIDATTGDQVYWSMAQAPWLSTFLTIRTAGDVNIASELRRVVASVDPTVAVSSTKPLEGIIATAVGRLEGIRGCGEVGRLRKPCHVGGADGIHRDARDLVIADAAQVS